MKTAVVRCLLMVGMFAGMFACQQPRELKLWYTAPARMWEEALPLGNGRLGAMPDGGVFRENITLNETRLVHHM